MQSEAVPIPPSFGETSNVLRGPSTIAGTAKAMGLRHSKTLSKLAIPFGHQQRDCFQIIKSCSTAIALDAFPLFTSRRVVVLPDSTCEIHRHSLN